MKAPFFPHTVRRPRYRPTLEVLERRECPAVTTTFAGGVLTVFGDEGPNQVSAVELGGGAVEVNGDGEQFPPFAGVQWIVIETFGGDDRVEYGFRSSEAVSDMGDRRLSIDVGAGDDVMILRDPGSEPGRATGSQLFFQGKLTVGTGSDYLRAEVNHGSEAGLNVFSADGGDDIGVAVLPAIHPISEFIIRTRRIGATLDLGGGGNHVSLTTGPAEEVDVSVKTSDRGRTEVRPDAHQLRLFSEGVPTTLRAHLDLGDADDEVMIEARGFGFVSTEIDAGGGNDTVTGKYRTLRPRSFDPPTQLAFDTRLGDGDDRLEARFSGYADTRLNLDFGAGADWGNVGVLWSWSADVLPFETSVGVNGQLGAGDDVFRVLTRGYQEVRADLNTGPDGDGADRVAAAFVLPGESGGRRNRVTLTSMDVGRLQVLGVGYATADIQIEGHQCHVFFLGGVP
jgi:hypothetical protein